jgi:hypothetical protein
MPSSRVGDLRLRKDHQARAACPSWHCLGQTIGFQGVQACKDNRLLLACEDLVSWVVLDLDWLN